ncbi:MAG: hypothetical protein FWG71_05745 [Synergistaceae bacterium]|nr:hypothetical protein [Synergistaceae bacterium]
MAALFFVVTPQAASGEGDAAAVLDKLDTVLLELKILREEIAGLRENFNSFANPSGVRIERADEAREASEVIGELRGIKSAALMFYTDNMGMGEERLSAAILQSKNSVGSLLRQYLDNPAKYNRPEFILEIQRINGKNAWLAGRDVSGKSEGVKRSLRERASSAGLLAEDAKPYRGENIVYMFVR